MNPAAKLPDLLTGELEPVTLNKLQLQLWAWYIDDIEAACRLAGDDEMVVAHVGDATQGNRFLDDLSEPNTGRQVLIAAANMEPWKQARHLRAFRFIVGTGVHVFGAGSTEMLLNKILGEQLGIDTAVVYHDLLTIDGVECDLAHHGPHPGGRAWLRGNMLRLYTLSLMQDELENGRTPPHFLARGHYHSLAYEVVTRRAHGQTFQTHACILPSYCFIGDHARKAAQSPRYITIGLVAVEIVGGQIHKVHDFTRTLDTVRREVL